jgi:glycine/D-amino acid oxidase-like deaminating enzyme
MRVLICGGGVIGTSIAHYLARRGAEPVVIERTGLACAASGKAGGFLALDWCDGTPLAPLARRSFALHAGLPGEIGGDWGYRRLETFGGASDARAAPLAGNRGGRAGPGWVAGGVAIHRRLGLAETTAQVHPARFTGALMRAAEHAGGELRMGAVSGVLRDASGTRATGIRVDGEDLSGDAVVIAMGPWSILAADWLPLPAVFGLKGHSIIFETGVVPPQALFLEHRDAAGGASSPEVFPRADGTTYVCAISSETPLPIDPAAVVPDPGAIERLHAICGELSPVLGRSRVVAAQACYRPVTRDGLPLIGAVPGLAGAYVATGHGVWGILNAPATGEAMAELILDGAPGLDLSRFDPRRLPRSSPVPQR